MSSSVKQVFKAADDSEHKTLEAAERRNALISASEDLQEASRRIQHLLAENAMTADGHPLDMSQSRDYWCVVKGAFGMAEIVRVFWWPHNSSVDIEEETVAVRRYESGRGYVTHRANELYASKEAARAAQVADCHKRLAELQVELAELEQSYKEKRRG